MSKETLLTKEQAVLLKRKKPAKRTKERYKYVNAAVAQAQILGLDKLVFVTMCEFADDNGSLWHGERSLATATGLSQPTVHRCIERLIANGAVRLLHKGASKWDTNIYKVAEIDTKDSPTVYTVAKFHRLQKQRKVKQPKLELILCESVGGLTDSIKIGEPGELILCESKDIEFDFDSSQSFFKKGNYGGFAALPEHLEEGKKSQSQNQDQNLKGSGLVASTSGRPQAASQTRKAEKLPAADNPSIPDSVSSNDPCGICEQAKCHPRRPIALGVF